MAKAFAYSILAAVLFAVHSITAFNLTVHHKMTKTERLAVFGSEDSVPKYEVFPMSLTGMRPIQKASQNIRYTLSLNGEEIKLNFKPTMQYLATKYIPVWLANSDRDAYKKIRYTPLPMAMSDVGKFTRYHDFKNKAAVVVYEDLFEKIVIEGMITSRYTIRSLPKRLIGELLNVVDDISKIPNVMGGTITSTEDLGFYAVITNPEALAQGVHNTSEIEHAGKEKPPDHIKGPYELLDQNLIPPNAIYPEILVVLDYNAIRHRTVTQALRFTLAFWNGIDMIFREFNMPKIRVNIAGVIVAMDIIATPYIANDTSLPSIGDLESVMSEMERYFYEERIRLPVKQYDIIMAMTTMTFCPDMDVPCPDSKFYPVFMKNLVCQSERNITYTKTVKNTMIMYYDANFGPAHLLSLFNDVSYFFYIVLIHFCVSARGHTTAKNRNLTPAECIQTLYSQFFTLNETECFRNKPQSIQPVDEVLPGRWLSMDGQCQNEGYAASCNLKEKIGICMAKGCTAKGSENCIESKKRPLPGSKCGTDEYCNKKEKCVYG